MKLYVGNLSYSTGESDLRELFAAYGTVDSVAVITDRDGGHTDYTTSITVKVRVIADRLRHAGERVTVTDAEVVYVAVDEHGRKTPVRSGHRRQG